DALGQYSDCVQAVYERSDVAELLKQEGGIDLVIPRGSYELVRYVMDNTRIPVIGHNEGICTVYFDVDANKETAISVILDAKTQYPSACNAAETLLVHRDAAERVLVPALKELQGHGVEIRGCPKTFALAEKSG
ncbi:gamma-glutamyl-phosphate reductase, partial [Candidatus Woesearchaeota archaeon CG_4_10_14_0_2_um_filter_57_5]